jgi:hypothetical protein
MKPTDGEMRNAHKKFHQRKLNIRETWWDPMAGFCKNSNKPSGTTEGRDFITMHKNTVSKSIKLFVCSIPATCFSCKQQDQQQQQ